MCHKDQWKSRKKTIFEVIPNARFSWQSKTAGFDAGVFDKGIDTKTVIYNDNKYLD